MRGLRFGLIAVLIGATAAVSAADATELVGFFAGLHGGASAGVGGATVSRTIADGIQYLTTAAGLGGGPHVRMFRYAL